MTASTVAADQPASANHPRSAGRCDASRYTGLVLFDTRNAMLHEHVAAGISLEPVEQDVTNLVLFQHQPERVRRVVAERAQIEIGNDAGAPVAILVVSHDIATLQHLFSDADGGEHLQSRRMDSGGTRVVEDLRAGLQHRHRYSATGEVECRGETDGTRASDQHSVGR